MQGVHDPGHPVYHTGALVDGHGFAQGLAADGNAGDQRRGPMEISTEVVLRSLCRWVTITAAVEPLTMPQMSPTTSLHTEDTWLAFCSRRMAALAPFPCGRPWSGRAWGPPP